MFKLYVFMGGGHWLHVEIRGQFVEVGPLLPMTLKGENYIIRILRGPKDSQRGRHSDGKPLTSRQWQ